MERVKELMIKCGAFLKGHFLLSSGRHSGEYCQCAKLFENGEIAEEVISILKDNVEKSGLKADKLVGPAMGGIIAAYELSRQMRIPNVFTERVEGEMKLRRGFEINPGEKVIIVEDVVTTGKSSLETAKAIEAHGGEVIGIACIVDRKSSSIDLPIISAIELNIQSWEAEECPLCKEGTEVVKPGSRAGLEKK